MFDDMHNISRSQQVMILNCHHVMVWVVVGRGFCFSQKTDVFPLLFDIVGQVKLSLSFCVRLIILFKRFNVLLYDMPKPNIYRILSKDNQVIYTLDTIYHDTSSRASLDILFSSNSFRDTLMTNAQISKGITPELSDGNCSKVI